MKVPDNIYAPAAITLEGEWYVQWGRTRDNLDLVRQAAANRGMRTALIEHPDQLSLRESVGAPPFDENVGVDRHHDVDTVLAAMASRGIRPRVLFPGFERFVDSVFDASLKLGLAPASGFESRPPFDKRQQRAKLSRIAPQVKQPGYWTDDADPAQLAILRYPVVMKPGNGSYASETFKVHNDAQRDEAVQRISNSFNFEGLAFEGLIAEEYVDGWPCSIQGIAIHGRAHVLTVCEQSVLHEISDDGKVSFREVGHLAASATQVDSRFHEMAQTTVDALGYPDGPFHIDLVFQPQEQQLYFLEMGYRMSGVAIASLVREVGGYDWAELSLAAYLRELHALPDPHADTVASRGQVTLPSESELPTAEQCRRQREAFGIHIEVQRSTLIPATKLWPHGLPLSVQRDLERRPNVVGQLVVQGPTRSAVVDALRQIAPTRVRFAADDIVDHLREPGRSVLPIPKDPMVGSNT